MTREATEVLPKVGEPAVTRAMAGPGWQHEFVKNKRTSGRLKRLADIEAVGEE